MDKNKPCPCNSGMPYARCCGPLHAGSSKALTAEMLMRSRYSAYATGHTEYLLSTWHPSTRPATIDSAAIPHWCGLNIIRTEQGEEHDHQGLVEFKATALAQKRMIELHEVSRFVREAGAWLYLSGECREEASSGEPPVETTSIGKVGRNSPCPCGSGRKFKKCCGG